MSWARGILKEISHFGLEDVAKNTGKIARTGAKTLWNNPIKAVLGFEWLISANFGSPEDRWRATVDPLSAFANQLCTGTSYITFQGGAGCEWTQFVGPAALGVVVLWLGPEPKLAFAGGAATLYYLLAQGYFGGISNEEEEE